MNVDLHSAARALGGEVRNGAVVAPGPNNSPKDRSMRVRFGAEFPGGFAVDCLAKRKPTDWKDAKDYVRQRCGIEAFKPNGGAGEHRPHVERRAPKSDDGEIVTPIPHDAPPAPATHPKLGKPTMRWAYRNATGSTLFDVLRFNLPDDGKSFLPLTLWRQSDGSLLWKWKGAPPLRPLYGLDRLAARPDAPVIICEGEKSADAAERLLLDHVAITSPNGNACAKYADWSPIAGRSVVIWPDADSAGDIYAKAAADLALAAGAKSVAIVTPPARVSKGWDAADALADGWTPERAATLIADATPYAPRAEEDEGESLMRSVSERRPMTIAAPQKLAAAAVSLLDASAIDPEPIRWLWPGYLARGKAHILGGQPGTGKTTITMKMAATVSTGGAWPDGSRCEPGNVIVWSGEDDPKDTLVPRLIASGADRKRIRFVGDVKEEGKSRSFDPAKDIEPLRAAIVKAGGAALVIVDPVVSAVAGDSHKNADVRRALQPLVDLCQELDAALLGITHFSKGTAGRDPVERITGSLAFGALARVVMVAAKKDPEAEGEKPERIFCRAKSNIGLDDGGFAYDLRQEELRDHPGVIASAVEWLKAIEGTARDLLGEVEDRDEGGGGTLAEAKDFLAGLLADGPQPMREVKQAAEAHGFTWITVRRAKDALGVQARKSGMKGGWEWFLDPAEGAHSSAKVLNLEHLRKSRGFSRDSGRSSAEGAQISGVEHLRERASEGAQSCDNEHLRDENSREAPENKGLAEGAHHERLREHLREGMSTFAETPQSDGSSAGDGWTEGEI
jgi:putative DNA primase/helicase